MRERERHRQIYIYKQTDRETERETNKHTETERGIKRGTEIKSGRMGWRDRNKGERERWRSQRHRGGERGVGVTETEGRERRVGEIKRKREGER